MKNSKKNLKPVLIVIEGGIADVRYCPPGIVVLIKDYDGECDEKCNDPRHCAVKVKGGGFDNFHLGIADHGTSRGKKALAEARRLMEVEL
jgi:hypothetical protein